MLSNEMGGLGSLIQTLRGLWMMEEEEESV